MLPPSLSSVQRGGWGEAGGGPAGAEDGPGGRQLGSLEEESLERQGTVSNAHRKQGREKALGLSDSEVTGDSREVCAGPGAGVGLRSERALRDGG